MKKIWIVLLMFSQTINAQWVNDPLNNTIVDDGLGTHMLPKVSVNPDGTYYFTWFGGINNANMNLALFSHEGESLWENQGMIVSNHSQNGWVDDYTLLSDSEGNAIIVFSDIRENSTKNAVAYKVNNQGNQLWGEDGIVFSLNTSDDYSPKASLSPNNELYIACFTSYYNGDDNEIIVHKLDEDGNKVWGSTGNIYSGLSESWVFPEIFANDDGGFSMGFYKETGVFPALDREIAMIRCDSDGNQLWDNPASVSNAGGIASWDVIILKSDENGGAYFVWHDDRHNDMVPESYTQHVNSDGETQWEENGLILSNEGGFYHLYAVPSGVNESGDFVVLWNKITSNQQSGALMYQRISPSGEKLDGDNGKTILNMSNQMQNGITAIQRHDSTFFLYKYFLPGSSFLVSHNILALNAVGDMLWDDPIELCTSEIDRNHPHISVFNQNQAVVTWSDTESGTERIMAQNFFIDGEMGTSTVGIEEKAKFNDKKYFNYYNSATGTIQLKNIESTDIITVYDLQGRTICNKYAKSATKAEVQNKGMYLVTISRNGAVIEKFKIVQN